MLNPLPYVGPDNRTEDKRTEDKTRTEQNRTEDMAKKKEGPSSGSVGWIVVT